MNFAGTPWNVTDVTPLKFLPRSVSVLPAFAFFGATFTIVGTGAVIVRKPYFSIHAWPAGLITLFTQACAAAWFGLFVTTAIAYAIFGWAQAGTVITVTSSGTVCTSDR